MAGAVELKPKVMGAEALGAAAAAEDPPNENVGDEEGVNEEVKGGESSKRRKPTERSNKRCEDHHISIQLMKSLILLQQSKLGFRGKMWVFSLCWSVIFVF